MLIYMKFHTDKLKPDLIDCPGFRALCPTQWIVWGDRLKSVNDNYIVLKC